MNEQLERLAKENYDNLLLGMKDVAIDDLPKIKELLVDVARYKALETLGQATEFDIKMLKMASAALSSEAIISTYELTEVGNEVLQGLVKSIIGLVLNSALKSVNIS